jgi:CTD nuclear envelope phosphatase 1
MESEEDYWSETAVARRAALRRRLFNEDSDSDSDGVQDGLEDVPAQTMPTPSSDGQAVLNSVAGPRSIPESSKPVTSITPPTRRASLEATESSSSKQPKSILKPSSRKKSVSFDASIPEPESPTSNTPFSGIGGIDFPRPSSSTSSAIKPVPIISQPQPKPPVRANVGEKGFAGFKKGFLEPRRSGRDVADKDEAMPKEGKVGKSLFAQRIAGVDKGVIQEVPELGGLDIVERVNLPRMSQSRGTESVKSTVVERPSITGISLADGSSNLSTHTAVNQARKQVEGSIVDPAGLIATNGEEEAEDDDDEEGEDADEDEDEYDSDEYDLDEALLAREAALELHRLRAHNHLTNQPLNHNHDLLTDPDLEEGEYADPETGVMLALPSITTFDSKTGKPIIVNPTPADIRKSVRIGRLENGNLVLAPGEGNWDSDEEDEATVEGDYTDRIGKEERLENREGVKRALLGLAPSTQVQERKSKVFEKAVKVKEETGEVEDVGLPPTVRTEVMEKAPAGKVEVVQQPSQPAKKISRFKAARMGI